MRHVHVVSKHKDVTVQMDTTYWGRNFGLMVIRDAVRGKILWHKYVKHETIADYLEGVDWLEKNGFTVYGIVCDGLRGLFHCLLFCVLCSKASLSSFIFFSRGIL